MTNRNGMSRRLARRRTIAIAVFAICAASCPPPLYADGGDPQAQDILQLLKQLQALQSASGEAAIMQDGFAAGETIATVAGQPEVAAGLKLLEGVLDFTGVFGTTSSNAQSQALTTLTRGLAQVTTEVANLQTAVNALNVAVGQNVNQAQITALLAAQTDFSGFKDQLYPSSHVLNGSPNAKTVQAAAAASNPAAQPVDRATAGKVATQLAEKLDLFIVNEPQYFVGDDFKTIPAVYGPKDPTSGNPPLLITPKQILAAPGLKPNPGLTTYIYGLQLWITAQEIESGGTDSGHKGIKQSADIQRWLAKHIAFLRSKANVGVDPNSPDAAQQTLCKIDPTLKLPVSPLCGGPIQDRIIKAVSCQWNVHGGTAPSNYPDKQGTCSATLSCRDDIAHSYPKIPPVSVTWYQQNQNSQCTFDPNAQSLTGGVGADGKALSRPLPFPPDVLKPVEIALQQQYGLMAMDRMASMLESVALYGTAVGFGATVPSCNGCNFGTKDNEPFFVYAVDESGNVKSFTGYPDKPLPQAVGAGAMANIRALVPGGGTTFYTVTSDGKLNWYQFNANGGSKPFSGPVTVALGFGAYAQVFGGGDGVIYAIQSDGTLVWYRHSGFANGGGPATMTGPKAVASGWGQYKNVFSAGSGILYATQADGSLLWYRHKNYLTGAAETANAKAVPGATAQPVNAKTLNQLRSAPSELDGPINVGSGWGAFRRVIASGDGVILAVQSDGKLLWYRHEDYLTGVSTEASSGAVAGSGVQNRAAAQPVAWGTQAGANAGQNSATGSKSLESSWGAPGQPVAGSAGSAPAQHAAMGTAQLGGQPQIRAGGGTAAPPSSLHASESAQPLHSGASPQSMGGASSGIGARQNMETSPRIAGTPHWIGPATIAAQSGWDGFSEIAAILPVTVQTNVIK